jgi:hypothetical protein
MECPGVIIGKQVIIYTEQSFGNEVLFGLIFILAEG